MNAGRDHGAEKSGTIGGDFSEHLEVASLQISLQTCFLHFSIELIVSIPHKYGKIEEK